MISQAIHDGSWLPIQLSKHGPKLSHLFFADDVLLFAKAKPSQARVIAAVLSEFCRISGLKISLEKSRALASKGVPRAWLQKLTGITQIRFTTNLGKYLRFKMFQGRPTKADFVEIMDKINSRLASWKSHLLNKPGRMVLPNSVLSSMPTYGMQLIWYPQNICDALDQTVRGFI